jgi:hypothetical protein
MFVAIAPLACKRRGEEWSGVANICVVFSYFTIMQHHTIILILIPYNITAPKGCDPKVEMLEQYFHTLFLLCNPINSYISTKNAVWGYVMLSSLCNTDFQYLNPFCKARLWLSHHLHVREGGKNEVELFV